MRERTLSLFLEISQFMTSLEDANILSNNCFEIKSDEFILFSTIKRGKGQRSTTAIVSEKFQRVEYIKKKKQQVFVLSK